MCSFVTILACNKLFEKSSTLMNSLPTPLEFLKGNWSLNIFYVIFRGFIFIDNFENVIVNITREQFEEQRKGRSFRIIFKRDEEIDRISETYADVTEGEKLALFNSAGYLEIAINKGNAAGLFGLKGYSEQSTQLFYQTVKVFFE